MGEVIELSTPLTLGSKVRALMHDDEEFVMTWPESRWEIIPESAYQVLPERKYIRGRALVHLRKGPMNIKLCTGLFSEVLEWLELRARVEARTR